MATYNVKFATLDHGKVVHSNATATITANSEHEAKEKFKSNHNPEKTRIISVVKIRD
jgi:hypothetical protein